LITGIPRRGLFDRDNPSGGETDLILSNPRNGPTKTVTVAHHLHLSRFDCMHISHPAAVEMQ
jgi:replicative DNA helicase